jgi:uncharacterized protein (DUF2062 family)
MPVRSHPLHRRWLARRRRLRRWLRPLPRRANVARYPVIKWFADAARRRPYLWSFKRPQVLASLYAGSVLALMPVYGLQVVIGLALAILLRGNLTVMVALQMITNPLTLGPIYYGTHSLGAWLLGLLGAGAVPWRRWWWAASSPGWRWRWRCTPPGGWWAGRRAISAHSSMRCMRAWAIGTGDTATMTPGAATVSLQP